MFKFLGNLQKTLNHSILMFFRAFFYLEHGYDSEIEKGKNSN